MDKVVNEAIVNKVAAALPEEEILYDVAELFKVFGDSTRIRIICVLFESEMCVYDLAACLDMTQSAISHQLRILKQANLQLVTQALKIQNDYKIFEVLQWQLPQISNTTNA